MKEANNIKDTGDKNSPSVNENHDRDLSLRWSAEEKDAYVTEIFRF